MISKAEAKKPGHGGMFPAFLFSAKTCYVQIICRKSDAWQEAIENYSPKSDFSLSFLPIFDHFSMINSLLHLAKNQFSD